MFWSIESELHCLCLCYEQSLHLKGFVACFDLFGLYCCYIFPILR